MKLKPVGYVIVERIEVERKGLIHLPTTERTSLARIIASPNKKEEGKLCLVAPIGGHEYEFEGKKLTFLKPEQIVAIVEE